MRRLRIKIASGCYFRKQMYSLIVSMKNEDVVTNIFVLKVEEPVVC